MSKYTTELRYICEEYAGLNKSEGYGDVASIIENSRAQIFDFDFPIYDEDYRSVLETKIIKHYYTREICAETVGRWKLFLNERMNLIMPYFNQRYNSTLITFNPLIDVDLTTDHNIKGSADTIDSGKASSTENETIDNTLNRVYKDDSETNTTQTNNDWQMYSDTPQGGLNGIEANTYLTNATHNTNQDNIDTSYTDSATTNDTGNETRNKTGSATNSNTRNFTNTEDYLEHITGKRSGLTYSKMLEEYRDTFLNIDNEIIENLSDLFLNLW